MKGRRARGVEMTPGPPDGIVEVFGGMRWLSHDRPRRLIPRLPAEQPADILRTPQVSIQTLLTPVLSAVRERAVATWRSPTERTRFGVGIVAWTGLVVATLWELWPMLRDFSTYGFHDWDVATAYRYITPLSLRRYHELPWWNPWLCGGFPAFGYVEGATNLVSPFLPIYLLTDVRVALRMEVLGTTLVGLAGTYVLAGRFTRSAALKSLVAVLAFLNGRWTLQTATGHGWHLVFCWLPWALWSFDRALEPGRWYRALGTAAFVAMIIYGGGIYPVPYTALLLTGYALLMVLFSRSLRPLWALGVVGPFAFGLGAPKLLAILDSMRLAPRLIESREVIGLAELWVMLTDRAQKYGSRPVPVPAYNWHEWGIYVGGAGVVCLAIGLFFARGTREHTLRMLGLACLLLGFGAFAPNAPWALLHRTPPFTSLHVPSRFHFPMVLLLALAFAAWAAPTVDRWLRRWPAIDLGLLVPVVLLGADIVTVAAAAHGPGVLDASACRDRGSSALRAHHPVVGRLRSSRLGPARALAHVRQCRRDRVLWRAPVAGAGSTGRRLAGLPRTRVDRTRDRPGRSGAMVTQPGAGQARRRDRWLARGLQHELGSELACQRPPGPGVRARRGRNRRRGHRQRRVSLPAAYSGCLAGRIPADLGRRCRRSARVAALAKRPRPDPKGLRPRSTRGKRDLPCFSWTARIPGRFARSSPGEWSLA